MNTTDILLFESGASGDFAIVNDDLLMGESLYQQIYLALFSGNFEGDTKQSYAEKEERFDYWGNALIWNDASSVQFNSTTERTIQNVALNSSGRLAIIQACNVDLAYLSDVITFSVEVSISSVNRLEISISFTEKTNQQDRQLVLVYENAKNELTIDKVI
jgi:phage gp46-like protein